MVVLGSKVYGIVIKRRSSSVTFDLLGQVGEGLIHVFAAFGADLQEEHVVSLSHFSSLLFLHLPLMIHITLGSDKYLADCLCSVALDLFDPACYILEGLLVIDGICEDDTGRSLVVSLSDVSKSLLSCCIPDLQLDFRVINVDGFEFEVHTNGGYVAVLEDTIAELSQQVGFTYPTVAYDDDLSKEIVFVVLGHDLFDY